MPLSNESIYESILYGNSVMKLGACDTRKYDRGNMAHGSTFACSNLKSTVSERKRPNTPAFPYKRETRLSISLSYSSTSSHLLPQSIGPASTITARSDPSYRHVRIPPIQSRQLNSVNQDPLRPVCSQKSDNISARIGHSFIFSLTSFDNQTVTSRADFVRHLRHGIFHIKTFARTVIFIQARVLPLPPVIISLLPRRFNVSRLDGVHTTRSPATLNSTTGLVAEKTFIKAIFERQVFSSDDNLPFRAFNRIVSKVHTAIYGKQSSIVLKYAVTAPLHPDQARSQHCKAHITAHNNDSAAVGNRGTVGHGKRRQQPYACEYCRS